MCWGQLISYRLVLAAHLSALGWSWGSPSNVSGILESTAPYGGSDGTKLWVPLHFLTPNIEEIAENQSLNTIKSDSELINSNIVISGLDSELSVDSKNITKSPKVRCQYQFRNAKYVPSSSGHQTFDGDEWDVFMAVSPLKTELEYLIQLFDKSSREAIILSQNITKEDCQAYTEDSGTYMLFSSDVQYFRRCLWQCHNPKLRHLPPNLSLSVTDFSGNVHGVRCEDISEPDDLFVLKILSPSIMATMTQGPLDIEYALFRKDKRPRCELRFLTVHLNSIFYMRIEMARSTCDKGSIFRMNIIPRGNHHLNIEAFDASNRSLAIANLNFSHRGPTILEDENALCLLSYSQSGNHFLRFILEYLTMRPTSGCWGNQADVPIYANAYSGQNPLFEVDPFATPAAYKFHYGERTPRGCSMADSNVGQYCKRLILLVRNFGECIPRFFEGMQGFGMELTATTVDEQAELYIGNIEIYEIFTGPKILVFYEDVISNSAAVDALAKFVGADANRAASFSANYADLSKQCLHAAGRSWMGVRNSTRSYFRNWTNSFICQLGKRFADFQARSVSAGAALDILGRYNSTLGRLAVACEFV